MCEVSCILFGQMKKRFKTVQPCHAIQTKAEEDLWEIIWGSVRWTSFQAQILLDIQIYTFIFCCHRSAIRLLDYPISIFRNCEPGTLCVDLGTWLPKRSSGLTPYCYSALVAVVRLSFQSLSGQVGQVGPRDDVLSWGGSHVDTKQIQWIGEQWWT